MQIPDAARPTLDALLEMIRETTPAEAAAKLGPEAWTLGEIVGHLVDSAGNNHQRFVRLAFGGLDPFPAYSAEPWVAVQRYASEDFTTLAVLFEAFNEHLLHVVAGLPDGAAANAWAHPEGPLRLDFLVEDYYAHMALHVEHYATRLAEVRAALA